MTKIITLFSVPKALLMTLFWDTFLLFHKGAIMRRKKFLNKLFRHYKFIRKNKKQARLGALIYFFISLFG
jgi:hypothetical protein